MVPLARAVGLCLALCWGAAWAEHDPFIRSFDAVPVKPTASINSGIALEGADMWSRKSLRAALLFDFNLNVLGAFVGDEKVGNLIPYRLDAHAIFAYQVHKRIDVGVDLPLVLVQGDNFDLLEAQGFPQQGVYSLFQPCGAVFRRGCGLADLRVVPRFLLLDPDSFPVGLAAIAEVRVPVGDGASFTGDRGWTVAPRVSVERAFGPLRVLGNLGWRLRRHGQFLNLYVGNEFAAGAGVIYRLPDLGPLKQVDAIGELHAATPTTNPFTFDYGASLKTPLELLVGARAKVNNRWGLELDIGRGVGVVSGYGRPDFRVIAGIRYDYEFQDRDGDGIPDDEDACPDDPEDLDGFEDSDGCPDPDNDKDGIPDGEDACPDLPGPREFDGCPDSDQDDVPDNVDKCPQQAGPPENEGCPIEEPPLVILESEKIRLKGNVLFETGSAKIQKQSYPLLDEVAKVLLDNPEVGPVLVEGHTDNRGGRSFNKDLSQRRARSVMEYLIKKGVDKKRLRSRGFGFEQPVATNATALGRAKNRRVEFTLIDEAEGAGEKPPDAPAPTEAPQSK